MQNNRIKNIAPSHPTSKATLPLYRIVKQSVAETEHVQAHCEQEQKFIWSTMYHWKKRSRAILFFLR